MEKNLAKKVAKELVLLCLQVIFSCIGYAQLVFPVGFPFALVRIVFGHNVLCVAGEYFVSKMFLFKQVSKIFETLFEIVVLSLFYFAIEFFVLKRKWLWITLATMLSKMLELYFCVCHSSGILLFCFGLMVSVLLAFYFNSLFVAVKNKSVFFKFSGYDYFVFSIFVLLIGFGIFGFEFVCEKLYMFFIVSLILFLARTIETEKAFIVCELFAVAYCILNSSYQILLFVFIVLLVAVNIKSLNKFLYAFLVEACVFVTLFVLNLNSTFNLIASAVPFVIFLLIKTKWLDRFSALFEIGSEQLISSVVVDGKIKGVKEKLELMSDTLSKMQADFKMLLVGKIDRTSASVELSNDVIGRCCKNCENYRVCFLQNIQKKSYFDSLLFKAFENKQIDFEDVSAGLSSYCSKVGLIVSEINEIAENFLRYESSMKNEDTSKLMIASELENFSQIFANFAEIVGFECNISKKASKNVKDWLLKSLIDVKEVLVYENQQGIESVCVIAPTVQIMRHEMAKEISRATRVCMEQSEIRHLDYSGISFAKFVPSGKLRVEFAISSRAKDGESGDNAVITKLTSTKYLVAITDGMGHGEKACRISQMVLSLIQSMYKIGLSNEIVPQSVNKLLLPAGLDNFSTLDACVIDLETHTAEFIKLGSSVSVLKHVNKSETIASKSLPIGIVRNVKPTIVKKQIFVGDMIFIASDGVVDSYESVESYANFINDSKIFNLKSFTDNLIFDASYQNQSHPDDMTVIAINLLKK